jgi:type I restriction enzyme, S subunit
VTWPLVALDEVCDRQTGTRDPRKEPGRTFTYIDIGSVDNQQKRISEPRQLLGVDAPSRARRVIRANDVIVSTTRPNLNAVAMVPDSLDRQICSTGFAVLRANDRVLPAYLFQFTTSPRFIRLASGAVSGAMYPAITERFLRSIKVSLPPLDEQRRIVDILNRANGIRRLRREALDKTRQLIPALFHRFFGEAGTTSSSVVPLEQLVQEDRPITYGILKPGPDVEGGVPYVRVVDIKHGQLHVHQLRKTTTEIAVAYRRSKLRPGDILVTIRGTVGRTCIVPDELDGANITQDTARLATIEHVDARYLCGFLNTAWAQDWMRTRMVGQTVKGINLRDLKQLPVPFPSLLDQNAFASRAADIQPTIAQQERMAEASDQLVAALMAQLFDGAPSKPAALAATPA